MMKNNLHIQIYIRIITLLSIFIKYYSCDKDKYSNFHWHENFFLYRLRMIKIDDQFI